MKVRMVKIAALLFTVTLACTGLYSDQLQEKNASKMNENVRMRANVFSEFDSQETVTMQEDRLAAGITGTLSGYLSEAEQNVATVSDTGNLMTATGQLEVIDTEEKTVKENKAAIFGYNNMGIAQVDGNLNIRKDPGTDAEIVGKMPNNAGCEILGVEGEWSRVKSGEVEGYVKSEYLLVGDAAIAKAEEVKQTIATVNATTLYVREQPNTECEVITMMPMGEELEVIEVLDGWVKINLDNDEGYVSADYVEITTELKKAMTMTEFRYGKGVSDVRVSLVEYACQFVGNPYVWGGTSLTKGADCSGFVLSVYAKYGVSLPHYSVSQSNYGTKISASEAKPGDLFFYGNKSGINHVAIYIGNGQIVHASSPKSGIKISNAYYRTPLKVVRILND